MKRKILVADDEPNVHKILSRALSSEAYEVVSASNGTATLDMASTENPDVIILDINMPLMDGWDVLKELRRDVQTRLIPVIVVSAHGTVSDKVAGLGLGADDYVSKPFDLEELTARIAGTLQRNKLSLCANPLTHLPGNPAIEDDVMRRIRAHSPLAFHYIDINHFKSFNDAYGFERGDRIIQLTAEIILDSLRQDGGEDWFAGHIGGDDFVALTDPDRAPDVAQRIASRFDRVVPKLYRPADRARGFLEIRDRVGNMGRAPIVSLSIGIVTNRDRSFDAYAKVVQIASEMKAYCKSNTSSRLSRFCFDRRKD